MKRYDEHGEYKVYSVDFSDELHQDGASLDEKIKKYCEKTGKPYAEVFEQSEKLFPNEFRTYIAEIVAHKKD